MVKYCRTNSHSESYNACMQDRYLDFVLYFAKLHDSICVLAVGSRCQATCDRIIKHTYKFCDSAYTSSINRLHAPGVYIYQILRHACRLDILCISILVLQRNLLLVCTSKDQQRIKSCTDYTTLGLVYVYIYIYEVFRDRMRNMELLSGQEYVLNQMHCICYISKFDSTVYGDLQN